MMREAAAMRHIGSTAHAIGAAESPRTSWLLCRVGSLVAALPIAHVIEIMRMLPLERLAGVPAYVRGLSIIRGAPVPVVDIGLIVGGALREAARLVTVRAGTRTVALAVDGVIGIVAIGADRFRQLPPLVGEAANGTMTAVGARDAELLVCLQTGRLVPEDVFASLDAGRAAS